MATEGQTEDVQRFDRWSGTYEQSRRQSLLFDRVHQVVLNQIASENEGNAPDSILDIGCGQGGCCAKRGAVASCPSHGGGPPEGMVKVGAN